MNMPSAEVPARTAAKIGMMGALRINPRRTAASGAAKKAANAARHRCFGLEVVSL